MNGSIENHLGPCFRVIQNMIEKYFAKRWENEDYKLTRAQAATLHYLYDHREQNVFQKDIEKAFSISGATASNTLKGLERRKLIERIPLKEDTRNKRIVLCEEGVRMHRLAFSHMVNMEETLVMGMTEEEITLFRDLLDRVIQNLETMEELCEKNKKYHII